MSKASAPKPQKVGGLAFFFSLAALILLLRPIYISLPASWVSESLPRFLIFFISLIIGALFARLFIRDKLSVFIHELKHSVLSNLAGNRAKSLEVQKRSGSFSYEYSKQTAAYNALISLAPYCLPLFSIGFILVGLPFFYKEPVLLSICMGLGWGIDIVLNVRDIGPHQSDLRFIRGGLPVALAYIFFFNAVTFGITLLWVIGGLAAYSNFLLNLADPFFKLFGLT